LAAVWRFARAALSGSSCSVTIYCHDDAHYKSLKAVLDKCWRPENVALYATTAAI
jgi:hypothetical protein